MRHLTTAGIAAWVWMMPLAGWLASAHAQATDVADDRAQSFRAVTGGVQEDVAGGPLMLGAYAAVWITLFIYVLRLVRLQRGVQANLERLERTVSNEASR
ncbi:MAG: CcmD family protein [Polyangiales bacterium]